MIKLERLKILQQAIGADEYGKVRRYKNNYTTTVDSLDYITCMSLVDYGFMIKGTGIEHSDNVAVFTVTAKGVDFVSCNSLPMPLTHSQKRYKDWIHSTSCLSFREWHGS